MRKTLFAALGITALVMSQNAHAQVRDCVIVGNILPIGQNSAGAIELTSGETCNMFLTTSGTVVSSSISERPKNGTLTLEGAGSMRYKPRDGYTGTDEFAVTVTGHTQAGTADVTSSLKVRATVK
jgi:Bacterial Ig domain